MKQYYKLTIAETGRDTLKDEPYFFNEDVTQHPTLEAVKEALEERYGKIPRILRNNLIYIDSKDGKPMPSGFTYSYWNKDISHNTKSWYQTDWITVTSVSEALIHPLYFDSK